ncbi:MAG: UPF0149 family protein [Pseudolabrys sp.]
MDGFLAALICGPELVPPSKYLPKIWGDQTVFGKRFADPLVRSMTGACKAGLGSTRWRYDCRRQNGRPIGRLEGEPRQSA